MWKPGETSGSRSRCAKPHLECLEDRSVPTAAISLANNILSVTGTPGREHLWVFIDAAHSQVVVQDFGKEIGRFDATSVDEVILTGEGTDYLGIANSVTAPAVIQEMGGGPSTLIAGGGPALVEGGTGTSKIFAGAGINNLIGGSGQNFFFEVKPEDQVSSHAGDRVSFASVPTAATTTTLPTLALRTSSKSLIAQRLRHRVTMASSSSRIAMGVSWASAWKAVFPRQSRIILRVSPLPSTAPLPRHALVRSSATTRLR